MAFGIVLLVLGAYGLAGWLWWRDRTPNYLVALAGGNLAALLSPLWQLTYQFSYDFSFAPMFTFLGHPLPWIVFFSSSLSVVPSLLVFYLYRSHWWFPGYLSAVITFLVFLLYNLLIESIGVRAGWWTYQQTVALPFGLSITLLSALMRALIGLGLLSVLILTRRYAWLSLLTMLLPIPLLLSAFVFGLLGAPFYTALLLRQTAFLRVESFASIIGALGTLGLVVWATHIVASVLTGQQRQQVA